MYCSPSFSLSLALIRTHTHIYMYILFYEFFTAQLNTIDGRVFDMDLYIREKEREKNEIDS